MFDNSLELASAIKAKKISVTETVNACIDNIEKTNGQLNAFLSVAKERALVRAQEIQSRINSGENLSPLAGVPIALKDNISTIELETTCGSKMLKGYKPVFNATVVEKLEHAGMIVIGKLNMDEFGMGSSGEMSAFGVAPNPWDISRIAGGSSSGSAAAVAGRQVSLALGSDTGGSIRQPCALCGITGIKPTYGAVSRYGLIAYASSLDQLGPMGTNIGDCAALLAIISGADKSNAKAFGDGTCVLEKPFNFDKPVSGRLDNIKIGIPKNYFEQIAGMGSVNEDIKRACFDAAKEFEDAGGICESFTLEEFEMPLIDYMIPVYYIISCAEASSNLARFDGLKYGHRSAQAKSLSEVYRLSRSEGFGAEVKKRIMLGSLVLSAEYYNDYYRKATQVRSLITNAYNRLFERFDMILTPVTPSTAHKIGENGSSMKKILAGAFNVPVNLAGLPSVALPCGFDSNGLPVGFQLVGRAFSEEKLISAARVYQSRTDHHTKKPPASSGGKS